MGFNQQSYHSMNYIQLPKQFLTQKISKNYKNEVTIKKVIILKIVLIQLK